ncbi:uncharacterized protein PRCAT00002514001 [Priceomyces carsonii]|uniref:uncharacterized protein n=1 Tax=Priceomyces carsonii TaxID=28549 RepID=UPI002ED793BF|nr:unnamed protein product [Priceomyces carsonii]
MSRRTSKLLSALMYHLFYMTCIYVDSTLVWHTFAHIYELFISLLILDFFWRNSYFLPCNKVSNLSTFLHVQIRLRFFHSHICNQFANSQKIYLYVLNNLFVLLATISGPRKISFNSHMNH